MIACDVLPVAMLIEPVLRHDPRHNIVVLLCNYVYCGVGEMGGCITGGGASKPMSWARHPSTLMSLI